MTVATEIKAIARELGVSQGLLARQARMSRASLSLKLNGRRDMTLSEVERLAAALGTTLQDLIARAERTDALAVPDDSSVGYAIQDAASGVGHPAGAPRRLGRR